MIHERSAESILDVTAMVLANQCVAYIMLYQVTTGGPGAGDWLAADLGPGGRPSLALASARAADVMKPNPALRTPGTNALF